MNWVTKWNKHWNSFVQEDLRSTVKSNFCKRFRKGLCDRGSTCRYSHEETAENPNETSESYPTEASPSHRASSGTENASNGHWTINNSVGENPRTGKTYQDWRWLGWDNLWFWTGTCHKLIWGFYILRFEFSLVVFSGIF